MKLSEVPMVQAKLEQLRGQYQVDILTDWGYEKPDGEGEWKDGAWARAELEKLHDAIVMVADAIGGHEKFVRNLGGVTVKKADIGSHGGEALSHRVSLSTKGTFSAWTVVHELAHAWDANYNWKLSRLLEKYTGGYTSSVLALARRLVGLSDSGRFKPEKKPGRYGRGPGCNAAGYFYGDKPSGSNWSFNRKEDFAESVAMYVGWERGNDLSEHARNRIIRYQLKNGEKDPFNIVDNWADYAKRFYPEGGDYSKTLRWKFVDELIHGRISAI